MTILSRPPAGWKRPPIPNKVKLQVIINQEGRSTICKQKLGSIEEVHFDHRPALWERQFDTEALDGKGDTIPPANDPAYIEAITVAQHDVRTHGPGGETRITTRGSDSGNRAKDRAVIMKQANHVAAMAAKGRPKQAKPKQKIPSRPFPQGRKFPSRSSS